MKTYKVTLERREIYRETVEIEADSRLAAAQIAKEMNVDWSDHEIVGAQEIVVHIERTGTKRFLVEQDEKATVTNRYLVEAESLDDAIGKVENEDIDVIHLETKTYPELGADYRYDDSREIDEKEWERLK